MKTIKCKCGKDILVDDEYGYLLDLKWTCDGKRIYRKVNGKKETMASYVFSTELPFIDHKDVDYHNNQKHNLRGATWLQNARNKKPHRNNQARYRGVFPVGNKWRAMVQGKGVRKNLGTYSTPEAAACAYNVGAKEAYGEFAYQNYV